MFRSPVSTTIRDVRSSYFKTPRDVAPSGVKAREPSQRPIAPSLTCDVAPAVRGYASGGVELSADGSGRKDERPDGREPGRSSAWGDLRCVAIDGTIRPPLKGAPAQPARQRRGAIGRPIVRIFTRKGHSDNRVVAISPAGCALPAVRQTSEPGRVTRPGRSPPAWPALAPAAGPRRPPTRSPGRAPPPRQRP